MTTPTSTTSPSNQKNPSWSRDELILALDLYMRYREALPSPSHAEVRALSQLLGNIGTALGWNGEGTFRNPNGVYMKLNNFRSRDPEYKKDGKKGLSKGNKDEGLVWNEFSGSPEKLAITVIAIRSAIETPISANILSQSDDSWVEEAEEGKVLTRAHITRERSRSIITSKKKQVLSLQKSLLCEACGFDFAKNYGSIGEGIIDVHHTKPLHTLRAGERTKLSDLALLCSNCHRIVHSRRKWLSIEEVRNLHYKNSKTNISQT